MLCVFIYIDFKFRLFSFNIVIDFLILKIINSFREVILRFVFNLLRFLMCLLFWIYLVG